MTDLQTALQSHHQAVNEFVAAARAVQPSRWTQARAPGKWSPGQVTEHVALAYEVNRRVLHGMAAGAAAPRFLRPLIRRFLLNPVLRRGAFLPGSASPKAFRPSPSPASPVDLLARLEAATSAFEADAEATAVAGATIDHPFFGRLPLTDFVWLQEIHTRHHGRQLAPVNI